MVELSAARRARAATAAAAAAADFTAIRDDDRLAGFTTAAAYLLDGLDHIQSLPDLSENHVLAIEMRRGDRAQEKLRAVGVRSRIRHGEYTWASVLMLEVLVLELLPIN